MHKSFTFTQPVHILLNITELLRTIDAPLHWCVVLCKINTVFIIFKNGGMHILGLNRFVISGSIKFGLNDYVNRLYLIVSIYISVDIN